MQHRIWMYNTRTQSRSGLRLGVSYLCTIIPEGDLAAGYVRGFSGNCVSSSDVIRPNEDTDATLFCLNFRSGRDLPAAPIPPPVLLHSDSPDTPVHCHGRAGTVRSDVIPVSDWACDSILDKSCVCKKRSPYFPLPTASSSYPAVHIRAGLKRLRVVSRDLQVICARSPATATLRSRNFSRNRHLRHNMWLRRKKGKARCRHQIQQQKRLPRKARTK